MRRRRRYIFHFRLVDVLIVLAAFALMVVAFIRWPNKLLLDVAIPTVFLVAFVVWRWR